MEMSSEASRALASVEARLATAMELITSAFRDIALLRTGQMPQQLERAIRPAAVSEESEPTLRSPQHAQLLNMIRARKSGHLLGEIHTWSEQNLGWDETATNDALQDLVESEHLEEPVIREQGIIYVAIRKVERHINTIDPKLLVAIMEVLVSAVPLERVRDMLSTFSEGWTTSQVRTALQALRTDGYVQMIGARRNARWEKIAELPEVYAKHVRNEEPFEDEHQARPQSELEDDFAITTTSTVRTARGADQEEGLRPTETDFEVAVAPENKPRLVMKTPATDRDWNSLLLDALEENDGCMDFEELVAHCKLYGSKYSFCLDSVSRTVTFNNLSHALKRLSNTGFVKQDGQDLVLVEQPLPEDDEDDEETASASRDAATELIRAAAFEQHQVLPNPPRKGKGSRNLPVTLTDWMWLTHDVLVWLSEESPRSTFTVVDIAINLAKEPEGIRWTIANISSEEVVRNIRTAMPAVILLYPDVEETRGDDHKRTRRYRIDLD